MVDQDKAFQSCFSGSGKYHPSLQRRATLGSKSPKDIIEDFRPVSDITDMETAYTNEMDALQKRLSSAEDGETQAKLDLVDMKEAFIRCRRTLISLHQAANSLLVNVDQYKEAYRDQGSTFATENDTLRHTLVEYANTIEDLVFQKRSLLESYQQKSTALKDQLAAEGRESEWLEEKNNLKRLLAEYVNNAENLRHQNQIILESSQQEKIALESQLADQEREYERLKEEDRFKSQYLHILKSSQQEKAVLERHLAGQGSECELLKEQVRAARKLSFQQIESPYWMPQAMKDTSMDLSQIQKKLNKWCKEWINPVIFGRALCNTASRTRLLKTVQHFVRLEENNLLPRNLSVTVTSYRVAVMLFSGLVSHLVFKSLFDQPFLRNVDRHSEALSDVFAMLKDRDVVSAENWRTQTFRLLNPSINHKKGDSEAQSHPEADTNKYIAEVAGHLAESTIGIASGLFMRDHFTEMASRDLNKIITPAAELACKLWCQKTSMQVADLGRLPEVLANSNGPFSACTEFLEEHPLHRRELATDKHALDYKSIAVVVSPAVLAYGDRDGTDFSNDTRHALKKALVWME